MAITEIECPVCHRIECGYGRTCEECHWVLRPIIPDGEKPYGYDVCVEISAGGMMVEKKLFHYKGSEATARRRAKNVRGFRRVIAVSPLREEQWVSAYGFGYEPFN